MRTAAQEDHILRPIAIRSMTRGKKLSKEEEVELDPNWRTHSIHSIRPPAHSSNRYASISEPTGTERVSTEAFKEQVLSRSQRTRRTSIDPPDSILEGTRSQGDDDVQGIDQRCCRRFIHIHRFKASTKHPICLLLLVEEELLALQLPLLVVLLLQLLLSQLPTTGMP